MSYDNDQDGMNPKVFLTGHDLGVVVCRGLAILLLFSGLKQVIDGLKLQLVFDYWQEGGTAASVAFAVVFMFVVVFGAYAIVGFILWWRADWVASRMLGTSGERVLFSGLSQESAIRIVVVSIGVWFGFFAIMSLAMLLAEFFYEMAAFDGDGGIRRFLNSDDAISGGPAILKQMFQPSVYLLGSLLCVFGSHGIVRMLTRLKAIGPDSN